MRQVKFRAYSKKRNQFVLLELENGTGDVIAMADDGTQDGTDLDILELQPWQQMTGLHDKNGKEIYEGDVVQRSINDELPTHKGFVEYLAPKFFVMDGVKSGLLLTDEYEVIGNVYETPELMKGI